MKYENFIEEIKACVEELCPNNTIRIEKVVKNNSYELDGLVIMREGADAIPTIYLNGYYSDYLKGRSIENIAAEIVEIDCKNRLDISIDIKNYTDFEIMRKRIMYNIVNFEKNSCLLEKVPNRKYLNFAIIYFCLTMETDCSCATWIVTNDFLKIWGVEEEELFAAAAENTCREMPAVIKSMPEIINEISSATDFAETEEWNEDDFAGMPMMYVITNKQQFYGAGTILYPDMLKELSERYGNFYVLPSSIHELIIVPDEGYICDDELISMVRDVNRTHVRADEFLSDEVYYYNTQAKELYILNK